MKALKWILPLAVLAAGAGVAVVMVIHRREPDPQPRVTVPPLVRALAIQPVEHTFTVRAQGNVTAQTEIDLVTEVAGRITRISPRFVVGGFFESGDLLIEIDMRDYELALARAQAALAEARVRLEREEAEAAVARKEWENVGEGPASALLLREPQLAQARASLEAAKADLQLAELNLDRCRIQAPFAGRVHAKQADTGQFLNRGAILGRIHGIDHAEVRLSLPLDDFGFINLPIEHRGESRTDSGPRVLLHASLGGKSHSWNARLVRTEGAIHERTRMITVVARVDNPYARGPDPARPPLPVGLFVNAEIEGKPAGKVFLAPRAALRNDNRLNVIDADSRLQFRDIDIVRLERDRVIFRDGLREGDLVCVSPLETPVAGMEVRLAEEESPASDGKPPTTLAPETP